MAHAADEQPRSTLSIWLQAARPFSYTASILPVLLGAMLALAHAGGAAWELFPLVVICSVLFQAGTNLVSDYFDYRRGADGPDTFGSSGVIVEGLLPAASLLRGGLVCFGVGVLLGVVLIVVRGVPMLLLGAVGLLGGYFYTGGPIGYKYAALGDILVFALMGPLMVIGSFFALTGQYAHGVLLASLPIGLLVAAILHANNLRDIEHDAAAHTRTLATLLGHRGAQIEYYLLVGGAYAGVVAMVAAHVLSPWSLLVFLSAPIAWKNVRLIQRSEPANPEAIATADVQTAQLHLAFGLLYCLSVLLAAVTR